ncbi:efflux RND transporter periplasmic adaptor subunit [bacterium]|nr:efflux RND transporter periplasmic adaptor subunit [bacterium]
MRKKIQKHWKKLRQQPLKMASSLLFTVVILLFVMRYFSALLLAQQTNEAAIPLVNVIQVKPTQSVEHIVIPGSLLAWHEAPIYARAKGYLKTWYVDIGYHVRKGDVLAVIERPELDAELREAEDYLNVVLAQYKLAQITAKRWGNLVKTDSVSKQANDNKNYAAQALTASLSKARANVEKLRAYVSFEQVIAPFTGVISLRQTDIGALINIGSKPAEEQPLFRIVQTDPLRLYVNIPQTYSSRVTPTMRVDLRFAEHPGQLFPAKLLKTAGAIDPVTLTLQAEFEVQNKDNILLPGSYTSVDFSLHSYPNSVIIPVNALLFRAEGLQVAMIEKDNRVRLKSIEVGTDFGKAVQINSGVQPGDQIIINPFDSIYQGQAVHVVDQKRKRTT